MKIFLTGSSGFIGQNLTKKLATQHELHHMASDLLEHRKVQEELLHANPDIIVHLAARTEVQQSFYEQITFSETNYVGTVNLIEAASKLKSLKNFVFASTMETYGWQPISDEVKNQKVPKKQVLFDENTPTNPNAPYAVSKLGCEYYLKYAARSLGLPYTIIRLTNCYGRDNNNFFVTEQIITQMLKNQHEINLGYAEPYRNFIYIDDMVDAWSTVISNPDKCNDGKIFTLGPDNAIQIEQYVEKIAKKLSWTGSVTWNTKPKRPGEIYWLNSDSNLIYNTLGWKPKIDLDTGLDKTIEILQR